MIVFEFFLYGRADGDFLYLVCLRRGYFVRFSVKSFTREGFIDDDVTNYEQKEGWVVFGEKEVQK